MVIEILTTRDYDKFTLHKKNRRLDYKKVKRLSAAIDENNLLHLFPIVVDKEFIILDGQHRFQAAKDVNAKVSYIISNNGYGIEHVAASNNFQSHWKLEDYVLYYAAEGRDSYKKLLHVASKYLISSGVIGAIEGKAKYHADIKNGDFNFISYDDVNEVLEFARVFNKKFNFEHWKRREFLRALRFIVRVKGFNKSFMIKQIQKYPKLLVRCYSQDEYINIFEAIYNKDSGKELRFF